MYYPNGKLINTGDVIPYYYGRARFQSIIGLAVVVWARTNCLFVLKLRPNRFANKAEWKNPGDFSRAPSCVSKSKNPLYNLSEYSHLRGGFIYIDGHYREDKKRKSTSPFFNATVTAKTKQGEYFPMRFFYKIDPTEIPFELEDAYKEALRFIKDKCIITE